MDWKAQFEKVIKDIGKPEWIILADAFNDKTFEQVLTAQELQVFNNMRSSPQNIRGYENYFPDIVAKYIGWKMYRETGLSQLSSDVKNVKEEAKANIDQINKHLKASKKDLEEIERVAKLASGATALVAYAEIFSKSAGQHTTNASKQLRNYFAALGFVLFIIGLVFFFNLGDEQFIKDHLATDLQVNEFALGVYLLKALLVFFGFQVVQFFRKNFNAEKHLAEVYQHRSDILQSLHAVYTSIDDKDEKDKLLSAAALFAYERGETGYITTKEGAGSADGLLDTFLGRLLK